jgi:hypothetical protein
MVAQIQSNDGKVIYEFKSKSELNALITAIRWARSGEGWNEDIMLSPILLSILKSLNGYVEKITPEAPLANQPDKVRKLVKTRLEEQIATLRANVREFLLANNRHSNLSESEIGKLVDQAIFPFGNHINKL